MLDLLDIIRLEYDFLAIVEDIIFLVQVHFSHLGHALVQREHEVVLGETLLFHLEVVGLHSAVQETVAVEVVARGSVGIGIGIGGSVIIVTHFRFILSIIIFLFHEILT